MHDSQELMVNLRQNGYHWAFHAVDKEVTGHGCVYEHAFSLPVLMVVGIADFLHINATVHLPVRVVWLAVLVAGKRDMVFLTSACPPMPCCLLVQLSDRLCKIPRTLCPFNTP